VLTSEYTRRISSGREHNIQPKRQRTHAGRALVASIAERIEAKAARAKRRAAA
jgi:hypothetical protein